MAKESFIRPPFEKSTNKSVMLQMADKSTFKK